jgi:hypothetical protein
MIEWVPIKDWKFETGQELLVFLRGKQFKNTTEVAQANVMYCTSPYPISVILYGEFDRLGNPYSEDRELHITHIAPINFPVEKTLDEKFEEFRKAANDGTAHVTGLQSYTLGLAQIAKEHYEGKE